MSGHRMAQDLKMQNDRLGSIDDSNALTFSGVTTRTARLVMAIGDGVDNSAVAIGGGTGTYPITTATASKNCMEFRFKTTATDAGSDTRCAYFRLYLSGATTGGGESMRAFTTVEAAVGTARGAHVSLNWGTSGTTSGLATAVTGTMHIPNTGTLTGNIAAMQAEMYCDAGSDDDVVVPATHGVLRLSVSGDSGNVGSIVNAIHITGVDEVDAGTDTSHMITTGCADIGLATTLTAALRILVDGTNYWIPLATAITAD